MSNWISIKETYPERGEEVLCIDYSGDMSVAIYDGYCFVGYSFGFRAYGDDSTNHQLEGDVAHWMPLPNKPK